MKESSSFSWTKVLKTCDNNEKLAKTMIERFHQLFFDDALKQLHDSITKNDNNDTSTQLHSLWANFLYIGAVNGETIVKEMEAALSQNNKDAFIGGYLELLDESKEIKKQVSKTLNNSPQTNDLEQFERSIKKDYPNAKQAAHRTKVPGIIEAKNKAAHTKIVQDKIRSKELQLDPNRLQSAYVEIKSPEFAAARSRILDQINDIPQISAPIKIETTHHVKSAVQGINIEQANGPVEVKGNIASSNKIEQAGFEIKKENAAQNNKIGSAKIDAIPNIQRLAQSVTTLSFDKIQLELKQFQDVLKNSPQTDIEGYISRLRDSAQKHNKVQTIDHSMALFNEIARVKPKLAESNIEVPSAEELSKYQRDIKQKFSQSNEFEVEVALEGKKNEKKTTCCCTF